MSVAFHPVYDLRLREEGNRQQVWDAVRKKWVYFSPEEFVRQQLIHYLTNVYRFPISRMAVEKKLVVNELEKRYDLVLFNAQGNPFLLAECKAPDIRLSAQTADQIAAYNLALRVPFLCLTNGHEMRIFEVHLDKGATEELTGLEGIFPS